MIKIEVKEGKVPWIVGIGTILFGILLGIACTLYPDDSMVIVLLCYLVIALIIASGIFLCLDGRNRKLTVEDMSMSYTNWFGREKKFSLDEIGYCKTALESKGNKDYLKLFDLRGEKLCKLEYHMQGTASFLQYLVDNRIKIECSENSDFYLQYMLDTTTVCVEEIPSTVNDFYAQAKELVWEWTKKNKKLSIEWKMGLVAYLESEMETKKQLWEQKESTLVPLDNWIERHPEKLPEGYLIGMEGYLQKDGKFVLNKKNWAVGFFVPIVTVTKSYQIGEQLKIRYDKRALEEIEEQLDVLTHVLPESRYHTEEISLSHSLKDKIS